MSDSTLCAGDRVDALAEREEHVLVPPHHALGHACRAAGVEHVVVVGGALAEIAAPCSPRRVPWPTCRRSATACCEGRESGAHGVESYGELRVVHDERAVGVVEQVRELVLDVAEVDVDRDGPQLERGRASSRPRAGRCSRRCRCGRPARRRARRTGARPGWPAGRARRTSDGRRRR